MKPANRIPVYMILLVAIVFISGCAGDDGWEIVGSSIVMDDDNVFLNVTPHTITGSQWIDTQFVSKQYSGNVDFIWGFNDTNAAPTDSKLYSPQNVSYNYTCEHDFIYTLQPNYFWCYENYTIGGVTYNDSYFEHSFDTGDIPTQTAYWKQWEEWIDWVPGGYLEYEYEGFNKWYYAQNQPITAGNDYRIKFYLEVVQGTSGKYAMALKPSDETIQEAIANEHFYMLDPWWDTGANNLLDELVVYYNFEDGIGSGSNAVNDSMGYMNGSCGTGGFTCPTITTGKIGNGALFSTDVFNVTSLILDDSINTTIAMWVDLTPVGGDNSHLYGKTTGTYVPRAYTDTGVGTVRAYQCGATNTGLSPDIGAGGFHLMIVTWNANTNTLSGYMDNTNWGSGTNACSGANTTESFYFGGGYTHPGKALDGVLDEIGIWHRVLNSSDRDVLWNASYGFPFSSFDDGTVDDPAPEVTLTSPANYVRYNITPTVNFNCNASDNNATHNITLWINGTANFTVTNTTATKNLSLSHSAILTNDGIYNWYCDAYDNASQRGVSETRYVEISRWCYQESHNVSTDCGGLANTNPSLFTNLTSPEFSYDGNWSTAAGAGAGPSTYLINYTIPSGVEYARWQSSPGGNITLNSTFMNTSILQLAIIPNSGNPTTQFDFTAWDGSKWVTLSTGVNHGNSFYEEGVWWYDVTIPIPPEVTLTSPANNSIFTTQYIDFDCNASDNNATHNITLWINGTANFTVTNTTATKNLSLSHQVTFTNIGKYNWYCDAYDNTSLRGVTGIRYFDSYNAIIDLNTPENNTDANSSVNFTANYTDADGVQNITLNITNSTGDVVNSTTVNLSGATNGTTGIIVGLADGIYNWFYQLIDVLGNVVDSVIYTITIDTTTPVVDILYPVDNVIYNISILNLTWDVTEVNPDTCWYNSSANATKVYVNCVGGANNASINLTESLNYTYEVYANDSSGYIGYDIVNFTIDMMPPSITITSPINDTVYDTYELWFNVSSSENLSSCVFSVDSFVTNTSLTINTPPVTASTLTNTTEGALIINYSCVDLYGNVNNTESINITIDSPPAVSIIYPTGNIIQESNTSLNWSITDLSLDSCWYEYNSITTNVTCADNQTVFTYVSGQNTISLYANDTNGKIGNDTSTWTSALSLLGEEYEPIVYETETTGFTANITSAATSLTAILQYNTTEYVATNIGNSTNAFFIVNRTVPEATTGVNTFRWVFNYDGNVFNDIYYSQTVNEANMSLCGAAPFNIPYINFSFKDEQSLVSEDATMNLMEVEYYLGDGSETKSYSYANALNETTYKFCFSPGNKTLYTDISALYSAESDYPLRRYEADGLSLSSISFEKILYLLGLNEGSYSTYQIQDSGGSSIEGVTVVVERIIDGSYQPVEQGISDGAGSVTFWLDPDYTHRFTFTKTGYASQERDIRPTQPLYTIIMQTDSSNAAFESSIEGVWWVISPSSGVMQPDETALTTFGFNVTSRRNNSENLTDLSGCRMSLIDGSGNVLNQTDGCGVGGGYISMGVNTSTLPYKTWGRYELDIGSGFFIVDEDAMWVMINYTSGGSGTIYGFFQNLRYMDEFGSDDGRQEFSRIVGFFIITMLILGLLTYTTGWDFATAGGSIMFLAVLIMIASVPGFLTISGLTGAPPDNLPFFEQYYIAIVTGFLAAGYMLRSWSQEAG